MKANKLLLAARHPAEVHLPMEGELPSLDGATAWLYQLNRQPGHVADRQFEIEFLDAGVEAYAFTFG
jgi:hypothetical protein